MPEIILNYKKFHRDAQIYPHAKEGDAGCDLVCINTPEIVLDGIKLYLKYETALGLEIPEGYVGFAMPRSSTSYYNLMLGNSVGVLDSSYRGAISLKYKLDGIAILKVLRNMLMGSPLDDGLKIYRKGDAICQVVFLQYAKVKLNEVSQLSETGRGDKGFGSSDVERMPDASNAS